MKSKSQERVGEEEPPKAASRAASKDRQGRNGGLLKNNEDEQPPKPASRTASKDRQGNSGGENGGLLKSKSKDSMEDGQPCVRAASGGGELMSSNGEESQVPKPTSRRASKDSQKRPPGNTKTLDEIFKSKSQEESEPPKPKSRTASKDRQKATGGSPAESSIGAAGAAQQMAARSNGGGGAAASSSSRTNSTERLHSYEYELEEDDQQQQQIRGRAAKTKQQGLLASQATSSKSRSASRAVSYTHLTLPTTPYV